MKKFRSSPDIHVSFVEELNTLLVMLKANSLAMTEYPESPQFHLWSSNTCMHVHVCALVVTHTLTHTEEVESVDPYGPFLNL